MNEHTIGATLKALDALRDELVKLRPARLMYGVGVILYTKLGRGEFVVIETPETIAIDLAGKPPVPAYLLQAVANGKRYVLPQDDVERGGFLQTFELKREVRP